MKKTTLFILIVFITLITITAANAFCDYLKINYDEGIYHITIDGDKAGRKLKFVSSDKLVTNKEAHMKSGAMLTVNAGFFDPKNQKTISYIVTDRITTADPLFNENLMLNPVLRQNIDKITNRTEFRVVECDGKFTYEIVPHKTPVDFTCSIETSAQGGPMILPELKLEEEFFIVKKDGKIVRESASMLSRCARTIIGLKDLDNGKQEIHILVITNKNAMTIYEVETLCRKLKLDKAMAFDGGSSTSLNYKKEIDLVSTNDEGGRMLKSFLIYK